MKRKGFNNGFFGTDGIRGIPGEYPLTDGMIFKIGISIAKFVLYKGENKEYPKVIIGRDSRLKGKRIETILSDAITFYGIDVLLADIITTPGVSYLVKDSAADMGIMISSSHSKSYENGIKLFNAKGFKLLRSEEEWLEHIIFNSIINFPNGSRIKNKGKVDVLLGGQSKYKNFLMSTVRGLNLKNIEIGLDCGWGAASEIAAKIFEELGAKVTVMNNRALGGNANPGGGVNTSYLQKLTIKPKIDIGIALDGDADRVLLVDEKNNVLDGDTILAILANHLIFKHKLPKNTIVSTIMSNNGLKNSLKKHKGHVISTRVGDKYILDKLINEGLVLGGEQSGKLIFLDYLPTSDGLITSLQILKILVESELTLSGLAKCIDKIPQVTIDVPVREKKPFTSIPQVAESLDSFHSQLNKKGRIVLRYSGTESLARIMVEGKEQSMIENIANSLASQIKKEIGRNLNGDNGVRYGNI